MVWSDDRAGQCGDRRGQRPTRVGRDTHLIGPKLRPGWPARHARWNLGGSKRVVERDLTEDELGGLRTAAEAVRAKQADVASL